MPQLEPAQRAKILLKRHDDLIKEIKHIRDAAKSVEEDTNRFHDFRGRYKELDGLQRQYFTAHDELFGLYIQMEKEAEFPVEEKYPKAVRSYVYECNKVYDSIMNPIPHPPSQPEARASSTLLDSSVTFAQKLSTSSMARYRLPKINIPIFGGDLMEWTCFRDVYLSIVHNEDSLSSVEKFHHLVGALRGEPLRLVSTFKLNDTNYNSAWKALIERYDNKRILAAGYLHKIRQFKSSSQHCSNPNYLREYLTIVADSFTALKSLDITNEADYFKLQLALDCLDPENRRMFEEKQQGTEFPSYDSLIEFIQQRCKILELSDASFTSHRHSTGRTKILTNFSHSNSSGLSDSKPRARHQCPKCGKDHLLFRCYRFKEMSVTQKKEFLGSRNICQNCLRAGHSSDKCSSNFTCYRCKERHHTILHNDSSERPSTPTKTLLSKSVQEDEKIASHSSTSITPASGVVASTAGDQYTLLGTAIVNIFDRTGNLQPVRAVLDSGSQFSIITEGCARRLGLPRTPTKRVMVGVGNTSLPPSKGFVHCVITPSTNSSISIKARALVISNLISNLPTANLDSRIKQKFRNLKLADDQFWISQPVEFLIGSDMFLQILTTQPVVKISDNFGTIPTIFGHVVVGVPPQVRSHISEHCFSVTENPNLESALRSFWESEEITSPEVNHHPDDMKCEEYFKNTFSRSLEGRYIVALPFCDSSVTFPNTRYLASKRFRNLELKLEKQPLLREKYSAFMQEYLDMGHMELASTNSKYIIPHHAVFKRSTENEKDAQIRVVFDASMPTTSGSLNDKLLIGPKLQRDISVIILNFRRHRTAFCVDIVKMFRQILVVPEHRGFQHILWRFNSEECLQTYELCTLTYGQSSSPYLALRVLAQLAEDEGAPFPRAVHALKGDLYVDDIITGADSLEEAVALKIELTHLLEKGCFPLHKWSSNSTEFMKTIPDEAQATHICLPQADSVTKVLGMIWDPNSDCFQFQAKMNVTTITKRSMLSTIARLFDPLGLLAPTIFMAKYMIQQLWSLKLDWDETPPPHIQKSWTEFLNALHYVTDIKIDRYIPVQEGNLRIFGFCDASEKGYAAALYVQVTKPDLDIHTSLLVAKTRLAPIKTISIPRLELCGAFLLTKLLRSMEEFRRINGIGDILLFTDSTIVLSWLKMLPQQLKTFVANRAGYILTHTSIQQWNHVPSLDNPADIASRGCLPCKLVTSELWWKGPDWMRKHPLLLPADPQEIPVVPDCKVLVSAALTPTLPGFASSMIESYSSLPLLIRTLAFVFRFINNLKAIVTNTTVKISGPLTVKEIENSTYYLITEMQATNFQDDFDFGSKICLSSRFAKLNIFEDSSRILRVGGRLSQSALPFDTKHPIILPRDAKLTAMIINHFHERFFHLGPKALQAYLLKKYYIFGLKSLVRKCVWNCIRCYKLRAKPNNPFMADLPIPRVSQGRPFISVGVDFAGPFYVKQSTRRNAPVSKAYMCLFVCMSVKAVHLELVSALSTDAFLAAFDRFIARRGMPTTVRSDCGTNFIGAARHLRDLYDWFQKGETQEIIARHTSNLSIQWHFNPPSAPHFGGLWEAAVKSAKSHLKATLGDRPFHFEELATIFIRIEAILNSRPLCPVTDNPNDFDCLTPGHFLIGSALIAPPEQDLTHLNMNKLTRWQLLQNAVQVFWKRWSNEYIHTLQSRTKWTKHSSPVKRNDLVLLQDPNTSPIHWKLGRIEETHPGQDGIVRVVTVKTNNGIVKRPVHRLCPIPSLNNTA